MKVRTQVAASGSEEQVLFGGRRSWRVSVMGIATMSTTRGAGRLRFHILSWSSGGRRLNWGNDTEGGLRPWVCGDERAISCEVVAVLMK